MSRQITIYGYCDSLCEQKGHSPMHLGYWAKDQTDNVLFSNHEIVRNRSGKTLRSTNNQAEYYSLIALHNACWRWALTHLTPEVSQPLEGNYFAPYSQFLSLCKDQARKTDSEQESHPVGNWASLNAKLSACDKISDAMGKILKAELGEGYYPDIEDAVKMTTELLFNADNTTTTGEEMAQLYTTLGHEDFKVLSYIRLKAYKVKASLSDIDGIVAEVKLHKNHVLNDNNLILHFHTDANLMYSHLCALPGIGNKEVPWKVRDPGLKALFTQVSTLKNKLNFTLEWIPREENERANQLAENTVARDNFKKSALESYTRRAECVEVKRSVNDLPDSGFISSYLKSDLPAVKTEFLDLIAASQPNWNKIYSTFLSMKHHIAILLKVIPETPDMQQSRRIHAEAGRLAKETLQLLDKEYRGRFNGPFISLVMNYWRAGKEITPDELAELARQSINFDKENPCTWFHNLVRMHSPLNSQIMQNAFNILSQEMAAYELCIQERNISDLRLQTSEFFTRLSISGAVTGASDTWTPEENGVWDLEAAE
jgi:ribonuclease HI